ncbi:hypothetical protein [Pseudomonas fluorescens]|uniref:hypothetical protein n=1 Tax=Pseudomonas TaxID=286 RepID=UPI003CFD8295
MTAQVTAPTKRVPIPDLDPLSIRQAPDGATLKPLDAARQLTSVIEREGKGLWDDDRFFVELKGESGTDPRGSYKSNTLRFGSSSPRVLNLLADVVAFLLGQTMTLIYTVERDGEDPKPSSELVLKVLDLPEDALGKGRILEAQNNGEGDELDLTADTKDRTVRIYSYPLIAVGQPVRIVLEGEGYDKTLYEDNVDESWITDGYLEVPVLYSELKALPNGSALTLIYEVAMDQGAVKTHTSVPRRYTVKTAAAVEKPAIREVKDADDTSIANGGTTSKTPLTLEGTVAEGKKVDIYNGATPLDEATVRGTTWTFVTEELAHEKYDFTAKEQGADGQQSDPWTVIVGAVSTDKPVIDAVTEMSGAAVPSGTTTLSAAVKLHIKAGQNEEVEFLVNDVPKGTEFADAQGDLKYDLTHLGLEEQDLTVKGVASGLVSDRWTIIRKMAASDGTLAITAAKDLQRKETLRGGATTANTIILQGTAKPATNVTVHDVFTSIKTVESDRNGYWRILLPDLRVHYYHFALSAADAKPPMLWAMTVLAVGTPIINRVANLTGTTLIPPYGEISEAAFTVHGDGPANGRLTLHELLSDVSTPVTVDAYGKWQHTQHATAGSREYHYVTSVPGGGTPKSNLYRVRKVASAK